MDGVGRRSPGPRARRLAWGAGCVVVWQLACDASWPAEPGAAAVSAQRSRREAADAPAMVLAAGSDAPEGSLVLIGDTQRTTLLERAIGREQNEAARHELVEKLAREERPGLIVHLGDLVSMGSSSGEWEYFDRLLAPVTAPIEPVLGNHEYWGRDAVALGHLRQRFGDLAPRTYRTLRHGRLGLVLVDSNLSGDAADEQARWFAAALAGFEREVSVRGVLVFAHHPPFTNGVGRWDDEWVTEALLPAFLGSRKAVLLASGHVHGYERFERAGKTFIVSGGGGGPRVTYRVGKAAPHVAAYAPADAGPRAFHYVVIEEGAGALTVRVKCLQRDAPCPGGVLETFVLQLPS